MRRSPGKASKGGLFAQSTEKQTGPIRVALIGAPWLELKPNTLNRNPLVMPNPDIYEFRLASQWLRVTNLEPNKRHDELFKRDAENTHIFVVGIQAESKNFAAATSCETIKTQIAAALSTVPKMSNAKVFVVTLDDELHASRTIADERTLLKLVNRQFKGSNPVSALKTYQPNTQHSDERKMLADIAEQSAEAFRKQSPGRANQTRRSFESTSAHSNGDSPRSADSSGRGSLDSRRNSADSPEAIGDFGRVGRAF